METNRRLYIIIVEEEFLMTGERPSFLPIFKLPEAGTPFRLRHHRRGRTMGGWPDDCRRPDVARGPRTNSCGHFV